MMTFTDLDNVRLFLRDILHRIERFELTHELAVEDLFTTRFMHEHSAFDSIDQMVTEAGMQPQHTVEDGADAILHLATASELEGTSGAFFDGMRESRADPEAYHARARQRLRTLSLELAGVSADVAR